MINTQRGQSGSDAGPGSELTPRSRVKAALEHREPDRVPVDFLATPEVWEKLIQHLGISARAVEEGDVFDPAWEAVLRHLEVDCRLISYDQFCDPPPSVMQPGAEVDWWDALSRSTPNRMWRQETSEGESYDIWGHHIKIVPNPTGAYEEFASWPLKDATSVAELRDHPWPEPDWWDFSRVPEALETLDRHDDYHLRFRIGSVFETAWQLRGMETFLMDLAMDPSIPRYVMDRITDVLVENTRRVCEIAGDRLDMVYFYDDVATQESLLISPQMWAEYVRPRHARLVEVAQSYDLPVMYHCDGSIYRLIPELIDLGVALLNPIQADAEGMDPASLKEEFGDRLAFHGGIDIVETLPDGTPADVRQEVRDRVRVLGENGGYVLASSHHIQSDTPVENVLAMYDLDNRYRDAGDSEAR